MIASFLTGDNLDLFGITKHALKVLAFLQALGAEKKIIANDEIVLAAGIAQKSHVSTTDNAVLRTNEFSLGIFVLLHIDLLAFTAFPLGKVVKIQDFDQTQGVED